MPRRTQSFAALVAALLLMTSMAATAAEKSIWQAAADGDVAGIKSAVAAGADVNGHDDEKGQTPLFHAIGAGKTQAVKALLEAKADPSATSRKGYLPLSLAAEKGHLEIIRLLVDAGADVNDAPPPNFVPLGHAALEGRVEAMKLLLELGADVNAENQAGLTALFSAAVRGRKEAVNLLLDSGAEVGHPNNDGLTPVSSAAHGGHVEVLKMLLEAGGDAADANEYRSAVTIAARSGRREAVLLLLDNGADVNVDSNFERSLLAIACGNGDLDLARELLRRGAKLQAGDQEELKRALREGRAAGAQLLVQHGAKLGPAEQEELLGEVVEAGHFDAAVVFFRARRAWNGVKDGPQEKREDELLAAARAGDAAKAKGALDGGVSDADVLTAALKFAKDSGKADVVKLLEPMAKRAAETAAARLALSEKLTAAAGKGDVKAVKSLLDAGADGDAHEPDSGVGAIHAAAEKGHLEVAKLLIARGAKLNASRGFVQNTPLRSAAGAGKAEMVKLLLKSGADPNAPSGNFSALGSAAFNGHKEVVKLLLDAGADVNHAGNVQGRTAVMWAAERGKNDVVELLVKAGADLTVEDEDGATVAAIAEAAGNDGAAEILRGADAGAGKPAPLSIISLFDKGPEGVATWLARGGDPNKWDPHLKKTPLGYAASGSLKEPARTEITILLLEGGADPAKTPGLLGSAVYAGRDVKYLKLLVDHGAEVNGSGGWRQGYTPLLLAASRGTAEQVQFLLEQGADVHAKLDSGEDAVALATKAKNQKAVELLKKAKASQPAKKPERLEPL